MTHSRTPISAFLLAGGGALLFASSASFLVLLRLHRTLAGDYGAPYVVAPLWVPIAFLACSALVLFGSIAIRRNPKHHSHTARRLAIAGSLFTVAAWAICGVSWLVASS